MVWLGARPLTGAALSAALLFAHSSAPAQPAAAPLDLPAAPVLVTGRVASAASRWDASTGTIVTYVAVDVAERLRGDVPARLVLKQLGGEVGGIGLGCRPGYVPAARRAVTTAKSQLSSARNRTG